MVGKRGEGMMIVRVRLWRMKEGVWDGIGGIVTYNLSAGVFGFCALDTLTFIPVAVFEDY